MRITNAKKYTYRVAWSEQDREYVATVLEFPSLSCLAETKSAAQDALLAVVNDVVNDLISRGDPLPQPLGE